MMKVVILFVLWTARHFIGALLLGFIMFLLFVVMTLMSPGVH